MENQENLSQQKGAVWVVLSVAGSSSALLLSALFMLHPPIIHFLSGKGLILKISPVWNAGGLFIKTGLALAKLNKDLLEKRGMPVQEWHVILTELKCLSSIK